MTELENWVCCFLWTQLNAYFSPSSLPNLSEAHNFSAANTNMVLNFPKLERHILVWKAFVPCSTKVVSTEEYYLMPINFEVTVFASVVHTEEENVKSNLTHQTPVYKPSLMTRNDGTLS